MMYPRQQGNAMLVRIASHLPECMTRCHYLFNHIVLGSAIILVGCVTGGPMLLPNGLTRPEVDHWRVTETDGGITQKPNLAFAGFVIVEHNDSWIASESVTTEPWYIPEDSKVVAEQRYSFRFGKNRPDGRVQCVTTGYARAAEDRGVVGFLAGGDVYDIEAVGSLECRFFGSDGGERATLKLKGTDATFLEGTLTTDEDTWSVREVVKLADQASAPDPNPSFSSHREPIGFVVSSEDGPVGAVQVRSTRSILEENKGAIWSLSSLTPEQQWVLSGFSGAVWYYKDLRQTATDQAVEQESR
jgi:hypothetical protein